MKNVLTIPSIVAGSKNGGASRTTNYDDLTNKPAIDGVVLTKNTTKADLGITTGGSDKYGIRGDYASKYGIINVQNGLITYASDSKEVTVKAGIQLLMPGSDIKTQIGSDIKYTINSTSDVTLFLADGEVKEAEGVYFQTEEPENGQEAYLAWFNPEVGKWQFKFNDDGNVWRTPTKAGPLADVHLSETGVIRVDYVGYRVLNDQIFALKSDLPVNAYTASNLVSGKNITIEEVLPEGGIDEHTLACWHFDGDVINLGTDQDFTINTERASYDTLHKKFGDSSIAPSAYIEVASTKTYANPLTFDFWCRITDSSWGPFESGYLPEDVGFIRSGTSLNVIYGGRQSNIVINCTANIADSNFHHYAVVYTLGDISVYIDGVLQGKYIRTVQDISITNNRFLGPNDIDELRISDIARPLDSDGKFPVPTQPYSVAEPTGKVAINNAITKTSQLINDSGYLTSVPENLVTTDTYQGITGRKDFADLVNFNGDMRASAIQLTNNAPVASTSGDATLFGYSDMGIEVRYNKSVNINTKHMNSGTIRPATLNGKQIATVDDISVNGKTGAITLTGADIETTYKANPEVTETTTSDINTALTTVCEDIHNVLTNVPTGPELMSTTVYPYQAPLATDATFADVITKVNTILAIMSERGIMEKSS